jgi:hypothetical protein
LLNTLLPQPLPDVDVRRVGLLWFGPGSLGRLVRGLLSHCGNVRLYLLRKVARSQLKVKKMGIVAT